MKNLFNINIKKLFIFINYNYLFIKMKNTFDEQVYLYNNLI